MSWTSLNQTATATAMTAAAARKSEPSDLSMDFAIDLQDAHLKNMLLEEREYRAGNEFISSYG